MSDNRTSEFLSLARALPAKAPTSASSSSSTTAPTSAGNTNGAAANNAANAKNPAYAQLRSFHVTASEISREIGSTSALLKELTEMVRRKSLLQDDSDSAAMNQLTIRIKGSMENLNSRLDAAATIIRQQKRSLGQNSQAGQEAANLVDGLKTEFAEAAGSFKQVLQQRTENMKESDDMQRQVYGGGGNNGGDDDDDGRAGNNDSGMPTITLAPPRVYASSGGLGGGGGGYEHSFPTLDLTSGMMQAGESTSSGLPRPHGISGSFTTPTSGADGYNVDANGMRNRSKANDGSTLQTYSGGYSSYHRNGNNGQQGGGGGAPLTPLDIQRMEEENVGLQQQTQLIPDQDYLRERADAMSTVETNIVELGTIFNKLAVMVNEHAEMVQRVEDNVDDANTNVNMSMTVLTDTLMALKTNRALAMRVFSILVVFIIMFIIGFA
jgi:syntaxin 5